MEGPIMGNDDEFIPNPMARYRQLLFAALKLCQALMTSLGVENLDAGNQVMCCDLFVQYSSLCLPVGYY